MATELARKIVPPYTPELLLEVQGTIEKFLYRSGCSFVLEIGSGWSTLWLNQLSEILHSVEHDRGWYKSVSDAISGHDDTKSGSVRIELVLPDRIPDYVARSEDLIQYDLILIDCVDEARLPTLFASLTRLLPCGWIVLDDSHWEMFTEVPAVMARLGYRQQRFSGMHTRKTGEVKYHQTDIFSRKGFA